MIRDAFGAMTMEYQIQCYKKQDLLTTAAAVPVTKSRSEIIGNTNEAICREEKIEISYTPNEVNQI